MDLDIRNELNRRLQNGVAGPALVKWLNGKPGVKKLLAEQFDGRPVNEQNLSDWRQGGYQDWLRLEAARDFIENMAEQSVVLDDASGEEMISDCFGTVLAAEMAQLAMKFLEQENDLEKRWNRLKEINREFSRMRRDDHRALRTCIQQVQLERQQEREEEEMEERRRRKERVEALFGGLRGMAPAPAKPVITKSSMPEVRPKLAYSTGKSPKPRAAEKVEVREDTPAAGTGRSAAPGTGALQPESGKSGPPTPDFGATSRIKPNQGKVLQDGLLAEAHPAETRGERPDAGVTINVRGSEFSVQRSITENPRPDLVSEVNEQPDSSS